MNVAPDPIFGLGLCAGGLGLELGLEIAIPGYRTVCVVEREISVCGRVAARVREGSLPEFAIWDDVETFDGRPWRGIVQIISAGFPCQPFSVAGKRKGTGDERWIWPDIARIIGEVFGLPDEPDAEPGIVFLENVPGLLLDPDSDFDRWEVEEQPDDSLGGIGTVLRDLAGLGFDAEWCCVRASDVGASHGRKRVFILAYRQRVSSERRRIFGQLAGSAATEYRQACEREWDGNAFDDSSDAMADTGRAGIGRTSEQAGIDRERSSGDDSRASRDVGNAECAERWPGAIGSGCSGAGIDGEGETTSRAGNGKPVLANSECSFDRSEINRNEIERADSERSSGWIGRSGNSLPIFAPGPSDLRWHDLLVQHPWLRPGWSQAEAESALCDIPDGLASVVVNDRTSALRTLGNGVVPLQAAWAFTILARRAGLLVAGEYRADANTRRAIDRKQSAASRPSNI